MRTCATGCLVVYSKWNIWSGRNWERAMGALVSQMAMAVLLIGAGCQNDRRGMEAIRESRERVDQLVATGQPWVGGAARTIRGIESQYEEYCRLLVRLGWSQGGGLPSDPAERLKRMDSVSEADRVLIRRCVTLQADLRRGLLGLWFQTGCFEAIRDVPYNVLDARVPAAVESYSRYIERNSCRPWPEIIKAKLPEIVDASGTEYSWPALWFLFQIVDFNGRIIAHHYEGEMRFLTAESRRTVGNKIKVWYMDNKDKLVWDARFDRLVLAGGGMTDNPVELNDLVRAP